MVFWMNINHLRKLNNFSTNKDKWMQKEVAFNVINNLNFIYWWICFIFEKRKTFVELVWAMVTGWNFNMFELSAATYFSDKNPWFTTSQYLSVLTFHIFLMTTSSFSWQILGILDFGRDAWIHREDWIRRGIHVGSGRKYKDSYYLQAQAMCYINS